jgi:hypothetical protein
VLFQEVEVFVTWLAVEYRIDKDQDLGAILQTNSTSFRK